MPVSIDDLITFRSELQEFSKAHGASVQAFYNVGAGWFEIAAPDGEFPDADGRAVRHLTTTITCVESLFERADSELTFPELPPEVVVGGAAGKSGVDGGTAVPEASGAELKEDPLDRRLQLLGFARAAAANPDQWRSDGAAYTYCRVRTLGAMLRLLTEGEIVELDPDRSFGKLVEEAWASREDSGWFGLRETTVDPAGAESLEMLTGPATPETYPPNAFLTYWGLLALDGLPDGWQPENSLNSRRSAQGWLERSLAMQIGFRYGRSGHADPQQLAWSICALVRFGDQASLAAHSTTDYALLTAGLKAFFVQQDDRTGQWDKGQPLFHYPSSGNAYCYTFETLAELVSLATRTGPASETLRDALHPYLPNLMKAFRSARDTRQQTADGCWGWSSGHHPHRVQPEAWATASVFRYAEALRRLVGFWSNAEAQRLLGARLLQGVDTALKDIARRGGSWDAGWGSAGAQLTTGYMHHIRRAEALRTSDFIPDPDAQVIPEVGGRSAMLFGPPGTGKTSIVQLIAQHLRWPFVEIVPAQFLNQGVDLASKRADEIFRHVMELDRCVVLLDEIDELIQARTRDAEPTERFFTTTMLPRLAKLWENRKILFFVNTNNVARVDSAIRRGQRFDSGIFVLPPGVAEKQKAIDKAGPADPINVDKIKQQLLKVKESSTFPADSIAWLPLIRYDQLPKLTQLLVDEPLAAGTKRSEQDVDKVVAELVKELKASDWPVEVGTNPPPNFTPNGMPPQVSEMLQAQRRDPKMRLIVKVSEAVREQVGIAASDQYATLPPTVESAEEWAHEHGLSLNPAGVLGPL